MGWYTYILEAQNGLIKVGLSNRPEDRAYTALSHSAVPVRLIAKWDATIAQDHESELKARFAEFRAHREWFRCEGVLKEFVEEKRGVGVDEITPWDALSYASASEKLKQSRQRAASTRKASRLSSSKEEGT